MCGINGIIFGDRLPISYALSSLRKMGKATYHRGPDAWGEWYSDEVVLGHNRLSIIDINYGHQPMHDATNTITVVFNGEIYNHKNLRLTLQKFGIQFRTSHSDTEVIANGYRVWGVELFNKMEGMFAVAIWDSNAKELTIARDKFGIKPIVYSLSPNGLVFSSEPKGILASDQIEPVLNSGEILNYFMYRGSLHPGCLFNGINKLPAGSYAKYSIHNSFVGPIQYFLNSPNKWHFQNYCNAEAAIESNIRRSVHEQCESDAPLGIFLSGGVDSSLIAKFASEVRTVEAYTVSTESSLDESKFALDVANSLGVKLNILRVTPNHYVESFDKWIDQNDDPVSDPSALALMMLSRFASSNGIKVMLSGEGADELFGGYNSYKRYKLFLHLSKFSALVNVIEPYFRNKDSRSADYLRRIRGLKFIGTAHSLTDIRLEELFKGGFSEKLVTPYLADRIPMGLRAALLEDQNVRLQDDILARTDQATMSYSIEARVPYLDSELVSLANSLKDNWCVSTFRSKIILKNITSKYISKSNVYRQKRGFDLPLDTWMKCEFKDRIMTYLSEQKIDLINYDYINKAYVSIPSSNPLDTANVWQWLVLEEWYRKWFTNN